MDCTSESEAREPPFLGLLVGDSAGLDVIGCCVSFEGGLLKGFGDGAFVIDLLGWEVGIGVGMESKPTVSEGVLVS
jgi:hypothetical protein